MYAYNKVFVNYLSENSFSDVHSFQGLELGEDTAADVTEFFAAADCSEKIKSIHHLTMFRPFFREYVTNMWKFLFLGLVIFLYF